MAEFWFLFICNMLVPVTMLVLGYLFKELFKDELYSAATSVHRHTEMKRLRKSPNAYWGKATADDH